MTQGKETEGKAGSATERATSMNTGRASLTLTLVLIILLVTTAPLPAAASQEEGAKPAARSERRWQRYWAELGVEKA